MDQVDKTPELELGDPVATSSGVTAENGTGSAHAGKKAPGRRGVHAAQLDEGFVETLPTVRGDAGGGTLRQYLATRWEPIRDWADERIVPLRFSAQVTSVAAAVLLLRRLYLVNPLRNSAKTASDLVANTQTIRVRCAAVVPGHTVGGKNRLFLRCQHVPFLRHGFFEMPPVKDTPEALHDFSRCKNELLDIELFGIRAPSPDDLEALAHMLQAAFVTASPQPTLKIRCAALGLPTLPRGRSSGIDPADLPHVEHGDHPQARSSPSTLHEMPQWPIQATVWTHTADLSHPGSANVPPSHAGHFRSNRARAEDLIEHASELGLSLGERMRLRVFKVWLSLENFLPRWTWIESLRPRRNLNEALVRNGFARCVSPDDLHEYTASVVQAGVDSKATQGERDFANFPHKNVSVPTTLGAFAAAEMAHLEVEEREARTCGRGIWANQAARAATAKAARTAADISGSLLSRAKRSAEVAKGLVGSVSANVGSAASELRKKTARGNEVSSSTRSHVEDNPSETASSTTVGRGKVASLFSRLKPRLPSRAKNVKESIASPSNSLSAQCQSKTRGESIREGGRMVKHVASASASATNNFFSQRRVGEGGNSSGTKQPDDEDEQK
eukprot:INCI7508.2.p1 GENE.INCI7508.2~~INCI7508.2.p1  ORF type:complete len:615 (+),score=87.55 INCI7508.2:350-2194(+)